jgi:hypothetical protein
MDWHISSTGTATTRLKSPTHYPGKYCHDGRGTEGWNVVHKRGNGNIMNREQMLILKLLSGLHMIKPPLLILAINNVVLTTQLG